MIRIRSYRWGHWWLFERYRADLEKWTVARGPHDCDHWETTYWANSNSQKRAEKLALRKYRKAQAEDAERTASERVTEVSV